MTSCPSHGVLLVSRVRAAHAAQDNPPCGPQLDRQRNDRKCSVAPAAGERGYDANKTITGRKRYIAVDIDGRLLTVNFTPANILESAGAQLILEAIRCFWKWTKHLFGDDTYNKRHPMGKAAILEFIMEAVRKPERQQRFVPLPKR